MIKRYLLPLLFALACTAAAGQDLPTPAHQVSEGKARILWSTSAYSSDSDSAAVRYLRSEVPYDKLQWQYSAAVPARQAQLLLQGLDAQAAYTYQLGFKASGSDAWQWTEKQYFQTPLPWGFTRFLLMIGALCLFIYGMKTMSEGLQATAGIGIRRILNSMTRNRFTAVLSGFLITGLLQSSSATTVMTVSFVNAGLISLTQSAGIMMGANIGTTITGWIVSLLGFRINLPAYALGILAIATPLLLIKKIEVRSWGTALIGFALLFLGLGFLKDTVPTFDEDSALVHFFVQYSNIPFLSTPLFVALGIIVTVIVQSSSSAIALTMTLCASGIIPFETAAAMVLGMNMGTTTTAEFAALVGNVHAKRSARIHTLFNMIGVAWMVFAMPAVLQVIAGFMPADPFQNSPAGYQAATTALAAFHSVFNLLNLLLLIWFVPQLVKLASLTVRSRGRSDEEYRLEYIDTSIQLSEISLVEARREVEKFGEITTRMAGFVKRLLLETDAAVQSQLLIRIKKYEKITDRMEVEIAQYCGQLSRQELSAASSEEVRALLSISNDLERVGDIFYQMSNTIERKASDRIWFTPEQREKLMQMFALLERAMATMRYNLQQDERSKVRLDEAKKAEKELNHLRNGLRNEHISNIEGGSYNLRSGAIYADLFSSLEKVGDHVISVSETLAGEI